MPIKPLSPPPPKQGGPFSDLKINIFKRILQNQDQIDYDDENDDYDDYDDDSDDCYAIFNNISLEDFNIFYLY